MSLAIEKAVLESACREMIETILLCLPNAFKGTIYRVDKSPALITERVTSGIIDRRKSEISWGLPEKSEYNPPGKPWNDYRDDPARPLEAMAWCVEKQKSWTSEDPRSDSRSVRLQVEGQWEDSHHMEPVLVRKSDLQLDMYSSFEYAKDYHGNYIWSDTDYVVVAVIKIHFQPYTIRTGSMETVIIKKLSRSLGTELLSYHLRQNSMRAMQQLAKDRINACDILADSLRNAVAKGALVFSLVKQEIGYLREKWEQLLLDDRHEKNEKVEAVNRLIQILTHMEGDESDLKRELLVAHRKFLDLPLPPEKAERWVALQIEERWRNLIEKYPIDEERKGLIWGSVAALKKSLYFGKDTEILKAYSVLPDDVKQEWTGLIYNTSDHFDGKELAGMIQILSNPDLKIPNRERSRKTLIQLKALAETLGQLEKNTNFLLRQVLNGGGECIDLLEPDRRSLTLQQAAGLASEGKNR
ncbi:MAG: hypothetical protein CVU57_12145 [Deltaproteobacteria bacterium HGW-Deltaproteobacteria-15]|nr:MAG: hypothetical protein CVU57_12145 [Deltaproteobacteria bacterium HGW-Deltaproteobacteria-15]